MRAFFLLGMAFIFASLGILLDLFGSVLPGQILGAAAFPFAIAAIVLFSRGETEPRSRKP